MMRVPLILAWVLDACTYPSSSFLDLDALDELIRTQWTNRDADYLEQRLDGVSSVSIFSPSLRRRLCPQTLLCGRSLAAEPGSETSCRQSEKQKLSANIDCSGNCLTEGLPIANQIYATSLISPTPSGSSIWRLKSKQHICVRFLGGKRAEKG